MFFNKIKIIPLIALLLINLSCSKKIEKNSFIIEKNIDAQILESWNEGLRELESGDALFAAKKLMKLKFYFPSLNGLQNQH